MLRRSSRTIRVPDMYVTSSNYLLSTLIKGTRVLSWDPTVGGYNQMGASHGWWDV